MNGGTVCVIVIIYSTKFGDRNKNILLILIILLIFICVIIIVMVSYKGLHNHDRYLFFSFFFSFIFGNLTLDIKNDKQYEKKLFSHSSHISCVVHAPNQLEKNFHWNSVCYLFIHFVSVTYTQKCFFFSFAKSLRRRRSSIFLVSLTFLLNMRFLNKRKALLDFFCSVAFLFWVRFCLVVRFYLVE